MKNHDNRPSEKRNNFSSTRARRYDKEMDHAFTLIFHNIKRLQDGHLSNSAPNLEQAGNASGIRPTMTLQVPLDRERSRSDPSLNLAQDNTTRETDAFDLTRHKSRSFSGASIGTPTQRRRVRFSDDYSAAGEEHLQRPSLTKRSCSDLLPMPRIVLTKEGWHLLFSSSCFSMEGTEPLKEIRNPHEQLINWVRN